MKKDGPSAGVLILMAGWLGIFAGVFAWYANLLWALGVVLAAFRKRTAAIVLGVLALPLAATVFSDLGRELPGDEGNATKTAIIRLLPGAYVWFLSLLALPLAAYFRTPKAAPPPFPVR
jgi:hypothetical protein